MEEPEYIDLQKYYEGFIKSGDRFSKSNSDGAIPGALTKKKKFWQK